MPDRIKLAERWWKGVATIPQKCDVSGLHDLTCGALWSELESWEIEVIAQHVEELDGV